MLTDGWKPFSSAMYVTLINCPSGAVYEYEPCATCK